MESHANSQHREILIPQTDPPKVPTAFDELKIPKVVLENLLIKHLAAYPKSDLLALTKLMAISSYMIEDLLASLRKKSLVEVFQPDIGSFAAQSTGQVRYGLSEMGSQEADAAFIKDAYLGPAPICLADYHDMVEAQDVRKNPITRPDVEYALKDVLGVQRMISALGPAINSGRALLLYGGAGTGKTFVATRILNSLNTSVYIPYAVYAAGNIIKVFSSQHHHKVSQHDSQSIAYKEQYDRRWVLCERPSVQVGGELTMEMLEVNHTEHNRVWMAPLQMMANNGILIIDDLGRQPMPVDTLLNRWIVPMEYFYDYLSLPNGQQISIPFILTLAFSTNLDPEKISDPAFLRRLGYKIQFQPLPQESYIELWQRVSKSRSLAINDAVLDAVLNLHKNHNIGYFPCLPKDLIGICRDIIVFEASEPVLTPDLVQQAWEVYFTADGNGGGAR
ncbi:AAA family ATPase [Vibrio aestuarianus]|uniref:ATP-binding protein n=1 Tax=Vibrio aestuarianus TaxID=28171 RepID=UPI00237D2538|nr:AAA family ATPase [Vibrio aestuarianus]MDE1252347.1 AAA family ATPase [Vibrio aestuarianus]MDE1317106.1 AAA family ATPase [Vibrio aestuarianus]